MNLWNKKDLPLPPISTFKALNKDINIKYLKDVCTQLRDLFKNNKHLHAEYLVLSQIVYRMKQKFRSSKDLKSLEKLYKSMQRFFDTNLAADIQTFLDLLPNGYSRDTYLPTKNLLDYILIRLQGVVKLMERIIETCKITGYLFNERLRTGQFWKIAFILFSLVSRVYILAKYITQHVCEYYLKLLPFSSKLKNVGKNLLPAGYNLPKSLKDWIKVDCLDLEQEKFESEKYVGTMDCLKMLKDHDDEESLDKLIEVINIDGNDEDIDVIVVNSSEDIEIMDIDNDVNKQENDYTYLSSQNITDLTNDDDDIGEIIPETENHYEVINITNLNTNTSLPKLKTKKRKRKIEKCLLGDKTDESFVKTIKYEDSEKLAMKKKNRNKRISKKLDSKVELQLEPKLSKINKKKKFKNKQIDISSINSSNVLTSKNYEGLKQDIEKSLVNCNSDRTLEAIKIKRELIKQKISCKNSNSELPFNSATKSIKKNKKKRKNKKSNVPKIV